jgi:CheY-like chemotaxis protein
MLVEDDNNLREIYEARLLAEGYEIVSAKDGEEALAIAVKEKPDLIISDVMMPKISGFDMLDILRSTPETKDTKVIMMTALSQIEDKQRADKLGADRYLVKSQVTLEDVAKVAREVIDQVPAATAAAATPAPVPTTPATPPAATVAPATAEPAAPAQPVPIQPTSAPADQPAANPVPAAVAQPTPIPISVPDASTTTPVAQPAPVSDDTTNVDQQINQFLAQPQVAAGAPAAATPVQPTLAAPATAEPAAPTVKQDISGGKRILQPIHDISTAPVDLNALAAKEQATTSSGQATIITPTQPPAA